MKRFVCLVLSLMFALPTLSSSASAASPPSSLVGLQSELSATISGWNGQYAVSITDLQSRETVSVCGAREQPAASTIKLFVAIGIAQEIDAGDIKRDAVDGLMRAMMSSSDNQSSYELIEMLGHGNIVAGTAKVNAIAQALGTTGTILDSPPDHPEIDLGLAPDNLLTSTDLNLILTKLYLGQILSSASTAYVLNLMTLPEDWQNGSVGGPLPPGTNFYHKPGWLDAPYNTWNDAGIVVVKRNGRQIAYVISYLSSFSDSEGSAYDNGYTVSAAVWNYFDAAYPLETSHYFPQTGYTVANGFLRYWEKNGGLDVFGYPLTGEITDNGTIVQYFERERFEWHPGAAPDDYDVLLGLLGNELTAGRRAAGEAAFKPAPAKDDNDCIYFSATGHNVCNGFRAYWQQFGGLALYGYPISEAFTENGTVVQYFERARFEWHPGAAPDRYDVLLGRLGAEVLAEHALR